MSKGGTLKRFPDEAILTGEDLKKRFDRIDFIRFGVVLAVLIGMIALIFSVVAMFWDQMRFNNVVYRDYANELRIQNQYMRSVSGIESKQDEILKMVGELNQGQVDN